MRNGSTVKRHVTAATLGAVAEQLQPVSAVYPGQPYDETPWINAVEAHTGVTTMRVTASPYDWEQAESWSRESLHLPLRPNTAGALMAVCANLKPRGIRVLLTGEGGDDWFAGSGAYRPDWFAQGRWLDLVRDMHRTTPGRPWWRSGLSALAQGLGPWIDARRKRDIFSPYVRLRAATPWIRADWARRTGLYDHMLVTAPLAHLRGFAQVRRSMRFQYAGSYVYYENVLAYAMAHCIEFRAPFHNRRLTAFAMALPGDQLLRHGVKKHILRVAMRDTLPELVRNRLSKAEFSAPIIAAIVQRAKTRPVAQLIGVREGWLDAPSLEKMLGEHGAWAARGGTGVRPASPFNAVWMAYATDLWLRSAAGV